MALSPLTGKEIILTFSTGKQSCMNRYRIVALLIFIATCITVMIAGCMTPAGETSLSKLPAPVPEQQIPAPSVKPVTEKVMMQQNSSPANMTFASCGISLTYPGRFREVSNESLGKLRAISAPTGIDILTILTATDSKDSIQVTRQYANFTIEEMYQEKMGIANEVAINGSATVVAMTFVQYQVDLITLADGTSVVRVIAQNSENAAAVTYLLCIPEYVYNINFVYESPDRAGTQSEARDMIMESVHLRPS